MTERLLAEAAHPPAVAQLKRELVERVADEPLVLGAVIELAGERYPQSRVSERLALCEQAVWELLHEGAVRAQARRRAGGAGEVAGGAAQLGDMDWG